MVDVNKLKWLGEHFQSLPRFRKKNNILSNTASLKFLKTEVERLKDMLRQKNILFFKMSMSLLLYLRLLDMLMKFGSFQN